MPWYQQTSASTAITTGFLKCQRCGEEYPFGNGIVHVCPPEPDWSAFGRRLMNKWAGLFRRFKQEGD